MINPAKWKLWKKVRHEIDASKMLKIKANVKNGKVWSASCSTRFILSMVTEETGNRDALNVPAMCGGRAASVSGWNVQYPKERIR